MAPTPAEQTVLITGASGFVAAHIVKVFLTAGYNVRATVRSEGVIPKVKAIHGDLASKLTFAIVPDIAAPHAFDEAVKGVNGVIHTASPFVLSPKDMAAELLEPGKNS
jgi:nucleoside-diphosphate-sugar epimerase